jgi:nucleotide-binding universal stress UspA family protein
VGKTCPTLAIANRKHIFPYVNKFPAQAADWAMSVFHNILVAVDGSPASLHALKESFGLAGGTLAAIFVAPASGPEPGLGARPAAYWLDVQTKALAAAAELARAAGVPLKTIAAQGEAHEGIVAAAEEEVSDLIVVGLKGRDLPPAALMGSTTARVIGFSPRNVLIVPESAGIGFKRLLLPTDGSRYSHQATEEALRICRVSGGELVVLSVLDAPPGFVQEAPEVAKDWLDTLQELTTRVQRRAESQGIRCQTAVLSGSAYRIIVEQARKVGASLIVMGSHGRTGIKRLLMGSVTERVVGYAPCPVLVVKRKK